MTFYNSHVIGSKYKAAKVSDSIITKGRGGYLGPLLLRKTAPLSKKDKDICNIFTIYIC